MEWHVSNSLSLSATFEIGKTPWKNINHTNLEKTEYHWLVSAADLAVGVLAHKETPEIKTPACNEFHRLSIFLGHMSARAQAATSLTSSREGSLMIVDDRWEIPREYIR
jgi:hypothetical protein